MVPSKAASTATPWGQGSGIPGLFLSGNGVAGGSAPPPMKAPPPVPVNSAATHGMPSGMAAGFNGSGVAPSNSWLNDDGGQPSKKRRTMWDEASQEAKGEAIAASVQEKADELGLCQEDLEWRTQWGEAFGALQSSGLEERAGAYAEAAVALWQQVSALRKELEIVQCACDQLYMTMTREALQKNLAALLEASTANASAEMIAAARKSADEMPAPPAPPPQPATTSRPQALFPNTLDAAVKQRLMGGASGIPPPPSTSQPRTAAVPARAMVPARVADDRVIHPMPMSLQQGEAHNNVYVSGLPPGIDDAMFRQLFQRYGPILSTKIVPDKNYGFVKFATNRDAKTAIDSLHNFQFGGTRLTVRYAVRDGGVVASPAAIYDNRFASQVPSSTNVL
eukprot:TRINITY_DN80780_c0_g1_i1.p1 TRINITY_DN80780_c0_g1~~TRINITY_DN80780_c0_g1_i1.p1  ORF type:complete len:394 (+),score=87.75 TRINITY_DN80780_c0_g1_i1:188-1369(+)